MQQRSWSHFRDAVDLIQEEAWGAYPRSEPIGGRTIKFPGAQTNRYPGSRLETVARRRSRSALQRRKVLPLALVLEFWWGAMTDLFTHWIDVVHWAMKTDQPRDVQMLADKHIFKQWIVPTPFRRLSAIPASMWSMRA